MARLKGIETGIDGLDVLLGGSIPLKSQMLVVGAPGTGKTIMAFEVLLNCARRGIPCAFIALDEKPDNLIRNAGGTLDNSDAIKKLISEKLLAVEGSETAAKIATNTESETSYTIGNLISDMEGIIKSVDAEIVVIDSLSFLKLMLGKTLLYNKSVSSVVSNLRRLGVASITTLEVPYYQRDRMKFGQELLMYDGVITMYKSENGDLLEMKIAKMRGSNHSRAAVQYSITSEGIKFK